MSIETVKNATCHATFNQTQTLTMDESAQIQGQGVCVRDPKGLIQQDTSTVLAGVQIIQAFAVTKSGKIEISTSLTPQDAKKLVDEAVDRAYMNAGLGTPATAKAYLDTTLNAIRFYKEHFPNDPMRGSYERLTVDIAVWMNWDPKTATPDERQGVLGAAEFTRANPKPDYYVTMEDPTLVEVFHKPVAYTGLDWVPTWLFNLLPIWFIQSFGGASLVGKPVRHPVDHRARAEALIKQIKDAL